MGELSEEEKRAITDIKAAMLVIAEKIRVGRELSDDMHATCDRIAHDAELLKGCIGQIEKLRENISAAASEIVSEEIAHLGITYQVIQSDYNKEMGRMRRFMLASITANFLLLFASIIGFLVSHGTMTQLVHR